MLKRRGRAAQNGAGWFFLVHCVIVAQFDVFCVRLLVVAMTLGVVKCPKLLSSVVFLQADLYNSARSIEGLGQSFLASR